MARNKLLENWKKNKIRKIEEMSGENITSITDFTAGKEPSFLFYILADKLNYKENKYKNYQNNKTINQV